MGVAPGEMKKKAEVEAKRPNNPAEIRLFLGLVTYMSKFVKDLATVSEPLRQLTRDNIEWKWGVKEEAAFLELKEKLNNAKIMAYFDKDAETEVQVDASPVG